MVALSLPCPTFKEIEHLEGVLGPRVLQNSYREPPCPIWNFNWIVSLLPCCRNEARTRRRTSTIWFHHSDRVASISL